MFRPIRRENQALSREESEQILRQASSGVLALMGDEDYPYAVPLSYVYTDGKIYFHCAPDGHKTDAVMRHDKCSFCVVGQDEIRPLEYTTCYRSVIVFGRIRQVKDEAEYLRAIRAICEKYAPHHPTGPEDAIRSSVGYMQVLCLDIAHMTGKQAAKPAKR